MSTDRKGGVNTALACFITAWSFPLMVLPTFTYLAWTRPPRSKPSPRSAP